MTLQEARQQIIECENEITGTYSKLYNAARNMGSCATQEATNKTIRYTLLPLIISLFGLILCFASHPVWGVILIIVGIIIAYNTHQSAASIQKDVERQVGNLYAALDNNSKI